MFDAIHIRIEIICSSQLYRQQIGNDIKENKPTTCVDFSCLGPRISAPPDDWISALLQPPPKAIRDLLAALPSYPCITLDLSFSAKIDRLECFAIFMSPQLQVLKLQGLTASVMDRDEELLREVARKMSELKKLIISDITGLRALPFAFLAELKELLV